MKHRLGSLLSSTAALWVAAAATGCGDDGAGTGGSSSVAGTVSSSTSSSSTASAISSSSSSSSTGTMAEPGTIEADWTIAIQGVARDCFWAGATYVDLQISPAQGSPTTARFDCEAASGSHDLPSGSYSVTPTLVAFDDTVVFTGAAADVEVPANGEAVLPIDFDLPGARIAASWAITVDGAPGSCEDAGAHRVEILANSVSGFAYANAFDCPLGEGVTDYFPVGAYEVVVSLLYEQDVVLVSSDAIPTTLEPAGATVDIDEIVFDVQPPTP